MSDAESIQRTAQSLRVEFKKGSGSPPSYSSHWVSIFGAKVDRVEINRDGRCSIATVWFPRLRWEQTHGLLWGDMVRITTNQSKSSDRTVLFSGFVTGYLSDFSGGSGQPRSAFERNAVVCSDYRWLLASTCPVYGQIARGPDDYSLYGSASQAPIDGRYTVLTGRRCIFNYQGRPNRDPVHLKVLSAAGTLICETPIFADPQFAGPWTARDMIRYLFSPLNNYSYDYLPIDDPLTLTGLDHADFDKVLNHVVADGLNVIESLQSICRQLGWGFREDYNGEDVNLVFYKIGSASAYTRSDSVPTILHKLHAPAVGESVTETALQGKKLLWSMSLAEDIGHIVNRPRGLGGPHRFEFTAELVPAWLDTDFDPDTSDSNANLFFTEAELQDIIDKNSKDFFKYYHPRGSGFLRDVGRKWALNESGTYSSAETYDRGMPFDFSEVIDDTYLRDEDNRRLYAPYNRNLLPCLTIDKDQLTSIGIRVEFSFDGGDTWQIIPSAIASLDAECGIYIAEANLAEIVDSAEGVIDGGDLDGIQLNFFTSLADDWVNSRSFKNGACHTRVRVTASVQMDQRLLVVKEPTSNYGSPFHHSQIFDFSEKYGLEKRTASSIFADGELSAREVDSTDYFDRHLAAIRDANEDMSVSGQFTLERLWLGDGSGVPDFALGDCIEKIEGRDYPLESARGERVVYPEIIQIIYMPEQQKMKLITRDLRFAEVAL